ncbi:MULTISPECIES: NnrS family protein [unclassified Neptuniibacter]|uniref:NnrS family protein n=1 Tax=unclassified Neptuniibacter TaxID=2630693 RepID=UPI000C68A0D2|nr:MULTISPECIES: NnrS family protein [unclassified Neptuniibacter]MAY42311.1 hypothetical protein [Oceanospirillaceae bacterium]|tara:strand:+ start:23954 stop:25132 length:1179 start_codon:yes stop_codon:yes gene_type:complete
MIQLQERREPSSFSLFNLGFRPFFLAGAISAAVLVGLWLIALSQGYQPNYYQIGVYWHAHEMIFGFSVAIIAGFLLTAVKTWTNVQTLYSWPLAGLFLLWLSARILPIFSETPATIVAAVDLAFLPLVAISIAWPIIRSKNYRNLVFVPVLTAFFIANLLFHLELLGIAESTAEHGIQLGLLLVIMVITIIGGRVIPFFTERGVEGVKCKKYPLLEKIIIPTSILWILISLSEFKTAIAAISLILGLMNLVRISGWMSPKIFKVPLVWILQVSYMFIVMGFFLYALSLFEIVSQSVAFHAFATGGIGGLTLGMMARVSLGHTGRKLATSPMIVTAFILMIISSLLRVGIDLIPLPYMSTLHLAGSLWILAWILFVIKYTPILIKPRVDGVYG